jgi:threonine dehydratase
MGRRFFYFIGRGNVMLTLDKIYHAAYVLKDVVRETKLVKAPKINPECEVYLKPECLQLTGSFKLRGSGYMISQLSEEEKAKGVIACSAGNHAQGVALAATKYGIKSLICLPDGAPISKVEATKGYGAEVCMVKGVYDDAYNKALELKEKHGYTFVHPFDDINVIAGQGTIGLEIMQEMADADAVVVPIGGGGLISGVAFAVKKLNPNCKVYGVQASGAPSMYQSIKNGKIERLEKVSTIADGIQVKEPGENTFKLTKEYVDEIVTVTEDEISSAILALIEQQKMVAEGAGAVSVAAVMFNKLPVKGKKVVCVVSGGNIDVTILSRVIKRGLMNTGRSASLCIELMDKPGQLELVSKIIAQHGGNVTSVHHERASEIQDINGCYLRLVLETRNFEHIKNIEDALKAEGFKLV